MKKHIERWWPIVTKRPQDFTTLSWRNISRTAPYALLIVYTLGCASRPPGADEASTKAEFIEIFEGRVQVFDQKKNKRDVVDMVVQGYGQEKLRFDLTGVFGIAVGTIWLDSTSIAAVLPRKKTYFKGPPTPEALKPLLNIALDPKILRLVVWDESRSLAFKMAQDNWSCEIKEDFVSKCISKDGVFTAVWTERNLPRKRVVVTGAGVEVQFLFKDYKTKPYQVGDDGLKGGENSPFYFEPPKNYKSLSPDASQG